MPPHFVLELDTTVPPVKLGVEGNVDKPPYDVIAYINVEESEPLWMKLWGSVDGTVDPAIQTTEARSSWVPYQPTRPVRLAPNGTNSTLNVKVRDNVFNTRSAVKGFGLPSSVFVVHRKLSPVKLIERRAFTDPRYIIVGYDR